MICYRDMTFCSFYKTCKDGEECHRALTKEVYKAADKWWGWSQEGKAPICQFVEKPDCYLNSIDCKEEA